jgi:hypothetical protein
LPRKWIDPVELGLVEVLVISSASARADARSWPNGFSTTTRAPWQPASDEALDDHAEEERRDLEVEDGLSRRPSASATRAYVSASPKSPAVGEPRGEALEDGLVDALAGRPRSRFRARSRRSSSSQSSTATPTIGQSSSPRRSRR